MFLPFNELPKSARIWVYQSDRNLSNEENKYVLEQLTIFCNEWSAHGAALKSSFQLLHNRFIIIAIDQEHNMASGCAIDSSINHLKKLGIKLNLSFINRTQVAFLIDGAIYVEPLSVIKSKISDGVISANTKIFNNLVATISDFELNWVVFAKNSWLKKYF